MKKIPVSLLIPSLLIAASLTLPSLHAAVTTWNATGGNWSVGGNWDTLAAPGPLDDVRFMNVGAGTPSTMNLNRTNNSLLYGQDNQSTHTTTISPGQTLSISRTGAGDVLSVGSTSGSITASTLTPVAITGNGSLLLSGTGDLVVRQGNSTAGAHMATLDLSGLDTLTATVGRLLVGQANAGAAVNRPSGTLILAKTNFITLNGAAPQVMIQDSGSNANGGTASVLTFGQETHLFGDIMRMGGQKGNANLNFNGAFTAPTLQIRNTDGVSRVTTIDFGYNGAVNSGNNTVCVADFSNGKFDLFANLMNIAIGNPGPSTGTCTGTLTVGAGTIDVNTLEIGFGIATGVGGAATATVNLNNNSLFSTGAVLVVNNTLRLARTNGGAGAVNGTLNLNGGTLVANSIITGGGNSTINVNANSSLVISNTAGTLAAPIGTFSVSDATLNLPASNGGAAIAVKTLTTGGSQNVLNITAVPPIGSYPATFTLIAYQTGAGGNFVLGSLPPASPAFSGTIVDLGNGVVSLQLTAGPVVDLSLRWSGAANPLWDSFTPNWISQGNPTNFFAGAAATFNDSATQFNVTLAEALSPGTITVSNNSQTYTFSGSGNIAAAASLTKKGTGTLILANSGVDNFGAISILNGTLQLGVGDVDGSVSALNLTNNGSLLVNRSNTLTLSSAITGSGTVTKTGSGTLILSGANSYNGFTAVSNGTLQLDQTSSGTGPLTTAPGTVLGGGGTLDGAATVAGGLNPGSATTTGIFKAHGGLTLSSGATATFDLSATDSGNPAVNDSIDVAGNLVLNNNTVRVNFSGAPPFLGSYLLVTYSGTLSGTFNPVVTGTHFPVSLSYAIPGSVYLNIDGDSGAALKWNSVSDGTWDLTTINWLNQNNSQASQFSAGDSVLFDDTAGVVTAISIPSGVNVSPAVITNDSAFNIYTISGPGHITGSTSLVKTNTGTLVIASANTFTGTVNVEAGVLRTDSDTALGTTAGGTTIRNGATLELNGRNLGGEAITVSGAGTDGSGAIVNNGLAQFQALRQVILAGDTTFGGAATWAINNGGGAASLSTLGSPYNLTKTGAGQVNLAQVATVDPALGDIDILQGTLEFSGLTTSMGNSARTNTVHEGGTLSFANGTVVWNKNFVLRGNGTTTTVNIGTGANTELAGAVQLHGTAIFNVGGTSLTLSSAVSGDGGLSKNGASPMILSGANSFTGDTLINTGALRLNGSADLATSSNITIAAGATLTVTGRVDATFTLVAGQTAQGNGVVNGNIAAGAGSILSPGVQAIGALTASNSISLAGTTVMELDAANATNDVLRCNGGITFGGTLSLTNLNGTLTNGSSFKLFAAAGYTNAFASITPATPGPGQIWDTSSLNTSGTIRVGVPALPRLGSIALVGTNLVISGSNGNLGGPYYVLASTNVALPRSNWSRIATNSFDGGGNFVFTNSVSPASPRRFFAIQLP